MKKRIMFGQAYRCGMCEQLLPPTFEINHIEPHCVGANNHPSNLVALCKECHGAYTQAQALWIRRASRVAASSPSSRLCLGCRHIVSQYFPHSCARVHTRGQFIRLAPARCWERVVDTWANHSSHSANA